LEEGSRKGKAKLKKRGGNASDHEQKKEGVSRQDPNRLNKGTEG